jgi:serine/threonine protein kinase
MIKKFQCVGCKKIVESAFNDQIVMCGHCDATCIVPADFAPGSVIDEFIIVSLLGEGGMGDVYLAHQFSLDRDVALKILKPELLEDPQIKEDFFYEARSVACLNHPNIIQAYKVGEENGVVFFAMEYVKGRNLADVLDEDGVVDEKHALSIAIDIVRALGYGWRQRKMLHRDIKPENIMLTKDGKAKLMDLGLSRHDGDEDDFQDRISGTPEYISPEQVQGRKMDIRGDLYSLGATLYHLVSGHPPFSGSLFEVVKQHLHEPAPPLRKAAPHVSSFFARIIHKLLAKDPSDRYDNADLLLKALRKDMRILDDEEHGKRHFKVNTTMGQKSVLKRVRKKKKKNDGMVIVSIVMVAAMVLGFLLMVLSVGNGSGVG